MAGPLPNLHLPGTSRHVHLSPSQLSFFFEIGHTFHVLKETSREAGIRGVKYGSQFSSLHHHQPLIVPPHSFKFQHPSNILQYPLVTTQVVHYDTNMNRWSRNVRPHINTLSRIPQPPPITNRRGSGRRRALWRANRQQRAVTMPPRSAETPRVALPPNFPRRRTTPSSWTPTGSYRPVFFGDMPEPAWIPTQAPSTLPAEDTHMFTGGRNKRANRLVTTCGGRSNGKHVFFLKRWCEGESP